MLTARGLIQRDDQQNQQRAMFAADEGDGTGDEDEGRPAPAPPAPAPAPCSSAMMDLPSITSENVEEYFRRNLVPSKEFW